MNLIRNFRSVKKQWWKYFSYAQFKQNAVKKLNYFEKGFNKKKFKDLCNSNEL